MVDSCVFLCVECFTIVFEHDFFKDPTLLLTASPVNPLSLPLTASPGPRAGGEGPDDLGHVRRARDGGDDHRGDPPEGAGEAVFA